MSDKHIKPCPFCAADAVIIDIPDEVYCTPTYYRVECKAGHALDHVHVTPAEAVETWNKRA